MIKLQSEQEWLAPDYYDRFRCKGGACRNSCCGGWGISVGMAEYFHLIGLDCSEELHHRLESAFHLADEPSEERYAIISPNWLGDCPMHDEDGLCRLHRECGEDALPKICRLYPRSIRDEHGCGKCSCSASCEAVVELLMEERGPLNFHEERLPVRASLEGSEDRTMLKTTSACIRLLQDRSFSLPQRLHTIGRLLDAEDAHASLAAEGAFSGAGAARPQTLAAAAHMLGRLSENSPSLKTFGAAVFNRYGDGDERAFARFEEDRQRFEALVPDWARIFENVLVNHIFYEDFPFADSRLKLFEEYVGLAGIYAAMRVMAIGYMTSHDSRADLADVIAGLFRCVEHAAFYFNADYLLEREQQNNPALLNEVLGL